MSHTNLGLIFPTCPNWIIIAWMTEGEWTKRLSTIHEWVCPFSSSTEALIICPCWRFAPDWIVLLGTDLCFTFCPFKSSNRKLPVDAKWQIASVYELLSGCPGSLWQRLQWLAYIVSLCTWSRLTKQLGLPIRNAKEDHKTRVNDNRMFENVG